MEQSGYSRHMQSSLTKGLAVHEDAEEFDPTGNPAPYLLLDCTTYLLYFDTGIVYLTCYVYLSWGCLFTFCSLKGAACTCGAWKLRHPWSLTTANRYKAVM